MYTQVFLGFVCYKVQTSKITSVQRTVVLHQEQIVLLFLEYGFLLHFQQVLICRHLWQVFQKWFIVIVGLFYNHTTSYHPYL